MTADSGGPGTGPPADPDTIAPPGAYLPGGDPDAGSVVGGGIAAWRAAFGPLTLIALVFAVPSLALNAWLLAAQPEPPPLPARPTAEQTFQAWIDSNPLLAGARSLVARHGAAGVAIIAVAAAVMFAWTALGWLLTYRLLCARLIGNRAPAAALVRDSVTRFAGYAPAALLALVFILGAGAAALLALIALQQLSGPVAAVVGLAAIPAGVWYLAPFLLVWPVAAAEPLGPVSALVRAMALAREFRGLCALSVIYVVMVALGTAGAAGLAAAVLPEADGIPRTVLATAAELVFGPLLCAIVAALYVDLWYRDAVASSRPREVEDGE